MHGSFLLAGQVTNNYLIQYRKIPKISPGANIFQMHFLRGLYKEGSLRFKIDYASLRVERKFKSQQFAEGFY